MRIRLTADWMPMAIAILPSVHVPDKDDK